ncbi:MAG TPA: hypothetical protein VKZ49_12970 [Polyangiaceae bacterium]|nr:hypothetical protein [Polyangiaceae bacterium]
MRAWLGAAVLAATMVMSGASWAQESAPTPEQIKAAAGQFDLGREAFKSSNYAEAAEYFEAADRHAPSAAAIELAIRSRDRAGQLDRAATLAALATRRHPDKSDLAELAEGIFARAGEELHRLRVTCEEPCELLINNKLVHGRPATERIIYLNPGNFVIRAGFGDDRLASEKVDAAAASQSDLDFQVPDPDQTEVITDPTSDLDLNDSVFGESDTGGRDEGAAPKSGGGLPPTVFWVGLGLTAVGGVATVWSGLDTVNNPGADAVRDQCRGQGTSCPLYQDGLERQQRTNTLLAVTGGLGLATGIIALFLTDWSGGAPPKQEAAARSKRIAVNPWIDLGRGATIGATGRF